MTVKRDDLLTILVGVGTITDVHVMGRKREGKPVSMLGRCWTVGLARDADGHRMVVLQAVPTGDPIMCTGCGGFDLDKPGGFTWECATCGGRHVIP